MIASRAGARNMEDEAGVSCHARIQRITSNQSTYEQTYMRVHQSGRGVKWIPKGQRWNSLSRK